MAKLARERRLMERRLDKEAKKKARKDSAAHSVQANNATPVMPDETPHPAAEEVGPDIVIPGAPNA